MLRTVQLAHSEPRLFSDDIGLSWARGKGASVGRQHPHYYLPNQHLH